MTSNQTGHRKKLLLLCMLISLAMAGLMCRLGYLMLYRSAHYSAMAEDLHQRERTIKAAQVFIGALPILLVYPFLQKYCVTGLVMGAVKE